MAKNGELTPKQQAFVREYLVDLCASDAARRAGYAPAYADRQGHQQLANPRVRTAIAAAQAKRAKKTDITAERVLRELARIAFSDVRNLFTWDEERACYVPSADLTDDQAAAISAVKAETTRFVGDDGEREVEKIKLELKTYDKLSALEKIAKHLGLLVDRSEHQEVRDITVRFVHEQAGRDVG